MDKWMESYFLEHLDIFFLTEGWMATKSYLKKKI